MNNEDQKQDEAKPEEEVKPAPHPLAPPTHAAGYRPPAQTQKPDEPKRVNPEKLPKFYFSGNVEIVSDGNGNITLNFKQH